MSPKIHHYSTEAVSKPVEAIYQYPQHLRNALTEIPAVPGVYFFWADQQEMPLYIGKSVNLRSRVFSHLRTVKEARLLKQTRRITWIPTAGDIGAQLLEARMIKQMFPLHNKRLRHHQSLCSLLWQDNEISIVYSGQHDFSRAQDLYGLFRNRRSAETWLRQLADEEKLCLSIMGLEKKSSNRPCFRYMLDKCRGACHGQESIVEHHRRLTERLTSRRLVAWPYEGRVAIREYFEEMTEYHVIDHWSYLGSTATLAEAKKLSNIEPNFDVDSYKILCKALFSESSQLIELKR